MSLGNLYQKLLYKVPFKPIRPVACDDIHEFLVMRPAMLTKGGSGPSGLNAGDGEEY